MRPTHPEPPLRRSRGVTLVELVIAMVVVAIIVAATIYFVYPLRQSVDLTARATLTDTADNALQRIGRDVRLALPNSVRVDGTSIQFIAVRTAGRYRADGGGGSSGTDCPADSGISAPDSDQLAFDAADTCFKSIGTVANANQILAGAGTGDFMVLNNYGTGFTSQDAYEAAPANRVRILTHASEAGPPARDRFTFSSTTFQRVLHDSPGRRFYVVSGPVRYVCAGGTITRVWNYPIQPDFPPTDLTGAVQALIAENVSGCVFDYAPNVAPQVGLLTLRLTLSRTLSGGETESVSLYHAVHVSNVP